MAARKSKGVKPTGRKVRLLRHWKQQFDRNAKFMWRRPCTWGTTEFMPGDLVTDEVAGEMGPNKLRRFWEASYIELAEFEEPEVAPSPMKLDRAFVMGESNVGNQAAQDEADAKALKSKQLSDARKKAVDKKAAEAIAKVERAENGIQPSGEE